MKTTTPYALLFAMLFYAIASEAQEIQAELKTSNISQTISNGGFLKYFGENTNSYNVDNNSAPFHLGNYAGIIISGIDEQGVYQTSINFSRNLDEFIPGILTPEGDTIPNIRNTFNRIWSIRSEEVQLVQTQYASGILSLSSIPTDIIEWPAKGNPYVAYNITENLAPFFDQDSNGTYDPLEGDYPLPLDDQPNFVPSQFSFCVYYNNPLNNFMEQDRVNYEIRQVNYTLDCEEDDLGNAVFTRLQIVNKDGNLSDVRFGLFEDYDLGCVEDDKVGCHPNTNSIFAYNEDGPDSPPCIGNIEPVPATTAAISSTIYLSHPLHSTVPRYFFDEVVAPPITQEQFHHVLNARFADGTPLTFGGDGYDPSSGDLTNFVFPDRPNDPTGWHQKSAEELFVQEMYSSIDLGDFNEGDVLRIDLAQAVFPFDPIGLDVFDTYEDRVNGFKNRFQNALEEEQEESCFTFTHCETACVWPGDVNDNGRVEADDLVYLTSMLNINTPNASPRDRISADWQGFSSMSWQEEQSGFDLKYGDVNGNSEINEWDLELLIQNLKLENEQYEKMQDIIPEPDPNGLSIAVMEDGEISAEGSLLSKLANLQITLGDENLVISAPIAALSFDLILDTDLVYFSPWLYDDEGTFDRTVDYYELEDEENPPISDVFNYSERRSYAMYEFDTPITEGGVILERLSVAAHNLVGTSNENGIETSTVRIVNILALDEDGNRIDLGVRNLETITVTDLTFNPTLSTTESATNNITIYPNPVSDMLHIDLNAQVKGVYSILNVQGALMQNGVFDTSLLPINTVDLSTGIYFIRIEQEGQASMHRFIKE